MKSPFPGMDPYLEDPGLWLGVQNTFVVYASDRLNRLAGPRFYAGIGERVHVQSDCSPLPWLERPCRPAGADKPVTVIVAPVQVREAFLEICETKSHRLVTAIEILSPWSKQRGRGRTLYRRRRSQVLESEANLVEIDLLRGGLHSVLLPRVGFPASDYRVVVSRAESRSRREVYAFGLRDRLPRIAMPLLQGAPDVVLDLQEVFATVYEKGAHRQRLDRREPPPPPVLSPADAAWARRRLARRKVAP